MTALSNLGSQIPKSIIQQIFAVLIMHQALADMSKTVVNDIDGKPVQGCAQRGLYNL